MNIRKHRLFFTYLLCFFLVLSIPTYAQNIVEDDKAKDDKVQSLGDILNPHAADIASAKTAKDMANIYYKKCKAEKSLAFDDEEKEILCACTSANMGEVLKVSEFNNMYKDNAKGKDARGKVIAYAYTDCMDYVIESKLYNDCMVSPTIKKIVRGKKSICKCSATRYREIMDKQATYIIMEALKFEPMTLNPLEHYFTTKNYQYMAEQYTKNCLYKMLYEKYN